MKIAFVVNDIATERAGFSTVHLAFTAHRMGHDVYMMGIGDLAYYPNGHMGGRARKAKNKKYKSAEVFLNELVASNPEDVTAQELDIIFLRNDPSDDIMDRPWAQNAGIIFGQIAVKSGALVLNDPNGLSEAINKMYFQHFPEAVRPNTLITRDIKEIIAFYEEHGQKIILKPLQGSGGKNVFLAQEHDLSNINQMVEAICRDGFVIAQEYLPQATDGDIRLFVMNGEALQCDGKYAAFRRVNESGDIRSNVHVGGKVKPVKVDDSMLELVDIIRPKLIRDGMFLVGIDIVGNKLMEINVFSPGGLNVGGELYKVDFTEKVIAAIEKKVYYKKLYGPTKRNKSLASL